MSRVAGHLTAGVCLSLFPALIFQIYTAGIQICNLMFVPLYIKPSLKLPYKFYNNCFYCLSEKQLKAKILIAIKVLNYPVIKNKLYKIFSKFPQRSLYISVSISYLWLYFIFGDIRDNSRILYISRWYVHIKWWTFYHWVIAPVYRIF